MLDLTDDFDVALFFATNRFTCDESGLASYRFVGTNQQNALIYLFRKDPGEMYQYTHERVLNTLQPLRPVRQRCHVCLSSPFALNLAADFLVGVIRLDFELTCEGKLNQRTLFPTLAEDAFLRSLRQELYMPTKVTIFH
jgi:hypothetical protein